MEKEYKYLVYKHTFPNGKVYIGLTRTSAKQRWANGRGYLRKIKTENMLKVLWQGL